MDRIRLILAPKSRKPVKWSTLVSKLRLTAEELDNKVHRVVVEDCMVEGVMCSRIIIEDVKLKWSFILYDAGNKEIFSPPSKLHYLQRITVHSTQESLRKGKKRQLAESQLRSFLGAIDQHFAPVILFPPPEKRKGKLRR